MNTYIYIYEVLNLSFHRRVAKITLTFLLTDSPYFAYCFLTFFGVFLFRHPF